MYFETAGSFFYFTFVSLSPPLLIPSLTLSLSTFSLLSSLSNSLSLSLSNSLSVFRVSSGASAEEEEGP